MGEANAADESAPGESVARGNASTTPLSIQGYDAILCREEKMEAIAIPRQRHIGPPQPRTRNHMKAAKPDQILTTEFISEYEDENPDLQSQ